MTYEDTDQQSVKQTDMPIFSRLDNFRAGVPKDCDPKQVYSILREQSLANEVAHLRSLPDSERVNYKTANFPVIYPACTLIAKGAVKAFSGLVLLSIQTSQPNRLKEIWALVKKDPSVYMAFRNLSEDGLVVLFQAGQIPVDLPTYQSYHAVAVAHARGRYALTDEELSAASPYATTPCFLGVDPDIWTDFQPKRICLTEEQTFAKDVDEPTNEPKQESEEFQPETKASASILSDLHAEQQASQKASDATTSETDPKEKPIRPNRKIIDLRTNEAAIDLWTWEFDQKEKEWIISGIYRTGILSLMEDQQYAKRYRPDGAAIFLIRGETVIEPVIDTHIRDRVKAYIESDSKPITIGNLSATYESRLEIYNRQQHLVINPKGLEGLITHERPLLRDTATSCFIPYQNGIVEITESSIVLQPYSILDRSCVWHSQVLNRSFDPQADSQDCHFSRFIHNITDGEADRLRAFRSTIGYLIHHFGNPAEGQAIICYDEEITDARKPEGGTGKGVFGNAIRQIRPVAVIDGKKFDQNDRFCFQQVNQDTAVVWIDDPIVNHPKAERRFTLERFFSTLTEGWAIEKKHEHAFRIPAKEGPKLFISSNVVMPNEGSSNVRRQFIIEFSNHYKKQIRVGNEKPIQAEHGCIFFSDDWQETEWKRFDRYMIGCVQDYMRDGLQPYALRSADQNRLRQTAGEEFYDWVTSYEGTGLITDQIYNRDELWRDYKAYAGLPENVTVTRGFTNNISQYAKSKGWKYERAANQRQVAFKLFVPSTCI